jgi:hypothetical protein
MYAEALSAEPCGFCATDAEAPPRGRGSNGDPSTSHFAREVASLVIFTDAGVIDEEGTPDEIFGNPQSERLKSFLSKVL